MSQFTDPQHQAFYEENGYITVPLLSMDEVRTLSDWYYNNITETGGNFHASIEVRDAAYRKLVDQMVKDVLVEKLKHVMPGYRAVIGGYVIKPPAEGGIKKMHSDWQYVDENIGPSFSMWIPLLPVDENNGALMVLPGSNKLVKMLRGQNTLNPYDEIKDSLLASSVRTVPQPPGEALIFDQRLIHGSGENLTSYPRLAITLTVVPEEAQTIHYYRDRDAPMEQMTRYEVPAEFYIDYDFTKRPDEKYRREEVIDAEVGSVVQAMKDAYCGTEGPFFNERGYGEVAKRKIMISDADEAELDKEGYIIRPFLSKEEIAEITGIFDQDEFGVELPLSPSTWSKNKAYRHHIHNEIARIFAPKLNKILKDYKPLSGAFIMKNPGEGSHLTTHFDWLFVDERRFASIHVWVPMVDVDEHNGAFQILPRSHKMVNAWRGRNTPDSVFFNERQIKPGVQQTLPMKAGEALIYDNRLLHGTPPNMTDTARLAAGLVMIPNESVPLHVYTPEERMFEQDVELYEVDDAFYFDHDITARPEGYKFLGKVLDVNRDETFRVLDEAFLVPKRNEQEPEPALVEQEHKDLGFFQRIKRSLLGV